LTGFDGFSGLYQHRKIGFMSRISKMGEIVGQAYLACKCIYLCSLIEARLFLGLDSLDDLAWAMISSLCNMH
jgi:hypothetical protein